MSKRVSDHEPAPGVHSGDHDPELIHTLELQTRFTWNDIFDQIHALFPTPFTYIHMYVVCIICMRAYTHMSVLYTYVERLFNFLLLILLNISNNNS